MIFSVVCLLARCLLGFLAVRAQREVSKDAADGQLALQDVAALILAVTDMQGRPGPMLVSKTLRAPPVERCDAFRPGSPARSAPPGTT